MNILGRIVSALCILGISFISRCSGLNSSKPAEPPEPPLVHLSNEIHIPDSGTIIQSFIIGYSVYERPLTVTRIGRGKKRALVLLGCIHGTEKNTQKCVNILKNDYALNAGRIPFTHTLFFLPLLNPDGFVLNTRENAHKVDLNCNFPTHDWTADAYSMTRIFPGIGGASPGSEPEVRALTAFLTDYVKPLYEQVIVLSFHSACPPRGYIQPGYYKNGDPETVSAEVAQQAARSAGYKYLHSWVQDPPITGELIHFCADKGIISMDVELPTYEMPEIIPRGKKESTLDSMRRMVQYLIDRK